MTELTFLIELLLNHDLPKETKDLIACRIKDVEAALILKDIGRSQPLTNPISSVAAHYPMSSQAPSTMALLAKHGDIPQVAMPSIPQQEPVAQIAQTSATAAAMASRNEAINASIAGKTDKITGRPRKW